MFRWRRKPKPPVAITAPVGDDLARVIRSGGTLKMKRVVFAGHGSFNTVTDAKYPKVRLPPSVTMVFWCRHGEELLNVIGEFVESSTDVSALPDYLLDLARQAGYSTDIPEVVKGGSEIWNYRLTYPSGLKLGNKPAKVPQSVYNPAITPAAPMKVPQGVVGDRRYVVVPPLAGDIKDRGVPIIALLAAHWDRCDGAIVHWCACRSILNR